MRTWLFFITI